MAATQIRNLNLHLTTTNTTTTTTTTTTTRTADNTTDPGSPITEYQGSGAPERYLAGTEGVWVYNEESDHLHTPEGNYESWLRYSYVRNTTETQILSSDPGILRAGGALHLKADLVLNDRSQILAGGKLSGEIGQLINQDETGERVIQDSGSVTSYWRDHEKGRDRTGQSTTPYKDTVIQTLSLKAVSYEGDRADVRAAAHGGVNGGANGGPNGGTTPIQDVPGAFDTQLKIRTGGLSTTVVENRLFHLAPAPSARYLIETDPAYASYRQWLSSDYLLHALSLDPELMQKRLGDGFYEQKLIREQVAQLTGRRFLEGYASDEAQYQALMNQGVVYAQAHQLRPGIALTAEQMAELTSDMVWLVEQDITLPDGQHTRALVPQVYVQVKAGDVQASGALISGSQVDLQLGGELINSGTIKANQRLVLNAETVRNLGGKLTGKEVSVSAVTDVDNIGGSIEAQQQLIVAAGRDVNVVSTTRASESQANNRSNANSSQHVVLDQVGGLYVTGHDGSLIVSAGRDLNVSGAAIVNAPSGNPSNPSTQTYPSNQTNQPNTSNQGSTVLIAGNDIHLGTVTESQSQHLSWDARNHRDDASTTQQGSSIHTQGALSLQAGHDVTAR